MWAFRIYYHLQNFASVEYFCEFLEFFIIFENQIEIICKISENLDFFLVVSSIFASFQRFSIIFKNKFRKICKNELKFRRVFGSVQYFCELLEFFIFENQIKKICAIRENLYVFLAVSSIFVSF